MERGLIGGFPPFLDLFALHYSEPNLCWSIDQQRVSQCQIAEQAFVADQLAQQRGETIDGNRPEAMDGEMDDRHYQAFGQSKSLPGVAPSVGRQTDLLLGWAAADGSPKT